MTEHKRKRRLTTRLVPKVLLGLLLAMPLGAALAQGGPQGVWQGVLGPGTLELEIFVTFQGEDDGLVGTINIPAQGGFDVPLENIVLDGADIGFSIAATPGAPRFEGTLDGDAIEGMFTQSGQAFPFSLARSEDGPPGLSRPQEPQPPFPYEEIEVSFESLDDTLDEPVILAGTLTVPEGDGPFPALLFITGSGAQDRNEEIFGHKPFLVIADHLTRAGYATLRLDDRGVGGSTGADWDSTFEQLADDVLAGVEYLLARPEIDPAAIGLLGHSQGGYLAPVVAEMSGDVAFVISIAGPAVDGMEVLYEQNRLLVEYNGALAGLPEDDIAEAVEWQIGFLDGLCEFLCVGDPEGAAQFVREYYGAAFAEAPPEEQPSADELEALLNTVVASSVSISLGSWMAFDPRPSLEALTVPYLGIYGTLDIQVPPSQSEAPAIEALEASGSTDWTIVVLDGLNHLMQPATTGQTDEYLHIETTIDPSVLELIEEWLAERF